MPPKNFGGWGAGSGGIHSLSICPACLSVRPPPLPPSHLREPHPEKFLTEQFRIKFAACFGLLASWSSPPPFPGSSSAFPLVDRLTRSLPPSVADDSAKTAATTRKYRCSASSSPLPPSALVPSPSPLSFFALQSAFWPRSGKAVAQIAAAAAIAAANERTNDEHIIARSQFANPQVARVHCRSVGRPGGGAEANALSTQ